MTYDLTGRAFGRLSVVRRAGSDGDGNVMWHCLCACGNAPVIAGKHMRTGHTKSCGCWRRENSAARNVQHGHARHKTGRVSRTYASWQAMTQRCANPNNPRYSDYGGRGIRVCRRWRKFANFLADMGARPADKTLDRINPDGNYTPNNCRWATAIEQRNNRRRFK